MSEIIYQNSHLTPPTPEQSGISDAWVLPIDNDSPIVVTGKFLGIGSSFRQTHIDHPGLPHAPTSVRCSGCRWFEARLFREGKDRKRYLLHYTGASNVPGETPRYRSEWVASPYEVIEALTTVRTDTETGERTTFLSYAARRALAQAAYHDDDLCDAYEGRMSAL